VGASDPNSAQQHPAPGLDAERVLGSVLEGLREDVSAPAEGVRRVYRFASDRMRAGIGDEAAFRRAFQTTLYAPLLGHVEARVEALERRGEAARASVWVRAADGASARFTVALARARHGDRSGCWLLSGLARDGVDL